MLGGSVLGTLFAPATAVMLLLSIATGAKRVILALRPRMTQLGSLLLAGLLIAVVTAQAQSDDPSETFLKAYMTAQQGDKLERDGQFTRALAKYRFAGSLLEELKKTPNAQGICYTTWLNKYKLLADFGQLVSR